jgi:ribose transport system permease protein
MMNFARWFTTRPSSRALGLLLLVVIVAAIVEPIALSSYGVTLDRVNADIIVAVGLTLVIILGEIDLSVGSTMAVAGVIMAKSSENLMVGVSWAIVAGIVIGLINAFLVQVAKVNSFIATLGTMTALAGLALLLTKSTPIPLADFDTSILFSENFIGQLTIPALVILVLTVLLAVFMSRTRIGREFYAVGSNIDAARAANINVGLRKTLGFVVCSALAAIAGVLATISQGAADPNLGKPVLLIAIAGAVLGGAALNGGRGSVVGAAIGSIALGGIAVTLELAGIGSSLEQVLTGAILFIAVVANREGIGGLRLDIIGRRLRRAQQPEGADSRTVPTV